MVELTFKNIVIYISALVLIFAVIDLIADKELSN